MTMQATNPTLWIETQRVETALLAPFTKARPAGERPKKHKKKTDLQEVCL